MFPNKIYTRLWRMKNNLFLQKMPFLLLEYKKILSLLPKELIIRNTKKEGIIQNFASFNMAPCDLKCYRFTDYSVGCVLLESCGMGLTPFGYYPCAVAGGFDLVMGFDIGSKKLPAPQDSMKKQLKALCRYCGLFRYQRTDKEVMSPTWIAAYKKYSTNKPKLSRY